MKGLFFALVFGFAALAAPVSAQTVAFTNVSLVPMDRERVLANQTVVIKKGLIAEIGNAKNVKLPRDAVRIDGTGNI
jgi:imidazolonepropionase-like amidohydrolase